MAQKTILIVSCNENADIQHTELDTVEELIDRFEQIGIDDCSTDLSLRGYPVVRGLVGPIPENKSTVRYETKEAFEVLTKQWAATKTKRRRRSKAVIEAEKAAAAAPAPLALPMAITPMTPSEMV
jgi:hypothetical protein